MMSNSRFLALSLALSLLGLIGCGGNPSGNPSSQQESGQGHEHELISLEASGLPAKIYQAIVKSRLDFKHKNEVMRGMKGILDSSEPKVRPQAIEDLLSKYASPELLEQIQRAVEVEAPPAPKLVLTLRAETGLRRAVYSAIANFTAASVPQRNAMMLLVKDAIKNFPLDQDGRDRAIATAVTANGAHAGWESNIIAALNAKHPIPVVALTSLIDSRLEADVYNAVLASAASHKQKNTVMALVRDAIAAHRADQTARDNAIHAAVSANGNNAAWELAIKTAVDTAHPIPVLTTDADSRLHPDIYAALIGSAATILEKNNAIISVRDAIAVHRANQAARDAALLAATAGAVMANPERAAWDLAIKTAVDAIHPIAVAGLTSLADSRLNPPVYRAVVDFIGPSDAEKNALLLLVRTAILTHRASEEDRRIAIDDAVRDNGLHGGWAREITIAVNSEHPIGGAGIVLTSKRDSGIHGRIYDALVGIGPLATNEEKNRVIIKVKNAVANHRYDSVERGEAIEAAVRANGDPVGWADTIILMVNTVYPAMEPVMRGLYATGLKDEIYNIIKNHAFASHEEKNEVFDEVALAIGRDMTKTARDAAINAVVLANGDHPDWASDIIRIVDEKEPLLVTEADSGLLNAIYWEIRAWADPSVPQKNQFMASVARAIAESPTVRARRGARIVASIVPLNPDADDGSRDRVRDRRWQDWVKSTLNPRIDGLYPDVVMDLPSSALNDYPRTHAAVIADGRAAHHINAILIVMKDVLGDERIISKDARDIKIKDTVRDNGGEDNVYSDAIIAAADLEKPLANLGDKLTEWNDFRDPMRYSPHASVTLEMKTLWGTNPLVSNVDWHGDQEPAREFAACLALEAVYPVKAQLRVKLNADRHCNPGAYRPGLKGDGSPIDWSADDVTYCRKAMGNRMTFMENRCY